ncbi:MAG: hypothetical protein ACERKD_01245 [Prolixibacteraceae bacterium]
MKKLMLFVVISFFVLAVHAQESLIPADVTFKDQTKNIIYGNVEYYLLGGAAAISYERYLFSTKKIDFAVRGTYGRWAAGLFGMEYGSLYKLTGNMLFFNGKHHLEVDLGANMLVNDNNAGIESVIPDLFCGYTFKKPDGHFVFKAGIGFVGFLSFGMGYAF